MPNPYNHEETHHPTQANDCRSKMEQKQNLQDSSAWLLAYLPALGRMAVHIAAPRIQIDLCGPSPV